MICWDQAWCENRSRRLDRNPSRYPESEKGVREPRRFLRSLIDEESAFAVLILSEPESLRTVFSHCSVAIAVTSQWIEMGLEFCYRFSEDLFSEHEFFTTSRQMLLFPTPQETTKNAFFYSWSTHWPNGFSIRVVDTASQTLQLFSQYNSSTQRQILYSHAL